MLKEYMLRDGNSTVLWIVMNGNFPCERITLSQHKLFVWRGET